MEDLTGRFTQALVPSSMNAGNTTADDRKWSMSAPGSPSVLPVADKMDNLPLPEFTGSQIPVSHPGQRDRVQAQGGSNGGGRFETPGPASGAWKEA
jgi:hypothetical protein